jgi:GT2 family glycosyltransferase
METKVRIAVLMTCFNWKKMTLEALDAPFNQKHIEDLAVTDYLVDDGSHDGTV